MTERSRPNIVLILADDMGYSDIGCYGSEIRTPNLDRLAGRGLRFSQMYNYARCCPSRATLLTGVSPHTAGIGHMVRDMGIVGYRGYLSERCVTIAEALKPAGYRTLMSGKWHVGGDYDLQRPESWAAGDQGHPVPRQRGFDEFFGTLIGAGSFFNPPTLYRNETPVAPDSPDFYYTDAIASNAVSMIDDAVTGDSPFFLYTAFTAPHWPLHAPEEDIARYEGTYRDGWDRLRTNRHEELRDSGLLDRRWDITPRDIEAPPWESVEDREWEALRMAVYAAQIDRMDQGIGRIMEALQRHGIEENTLVMFLSDNGGCAEFLAEDSDKPEPSQFNTPTLDGSTMRFGNITGHRPGPGNTFMSYDLPWANASNAPFRLYKHWVHEGGISTPFIMHWPSVIRSAAIVHEPAQLMDITATCLDAAGAAYPSDRGGEEIASLEGQSLVPVAEGRKWSRQTPIFWEHEGNRAVRQGQWKLVSRFPGEWELYDMVEDRTELVNLADGEKNRVAAMSGQYERWAAQAGVAEWPLKGNPYSSARGGTSSHIVGR